MKITRVEAIELWLPEDEVLEHKASCLKKMTDISALPIAAGEGVMGRFAWRHLIETSGIDRSQ